MIEEDVKDYYEKLGIDEWNRLVKDPFHRLEWDTTWHYLEKYLPRKGLVLDAGGGPGRYSLELARRGYDVVLLDLTPRFLKMAKRRAKRRGLADKISFVEGSIENLPFDDNTFDAVLCLGGALNHLLKKRKRKKAERELVRVLKPGKPIFISVIGRLHVPMLACKRRYLEMLKAPEVFLKYSITGDYEGGWGFAPIHMYDPEELVQEMKDLVKIDKLVGLEGVFSLDKENYNKLYRNKRYREVLQKLHFALCEDPHIVAVSQHFMLIGKKPKGIKTSQ